MSKREDAAVAALAMRAWLANPTTGGERTIAHLLLARLRRGMWVEMWSNLPGLMRDRSTGQYAHALLPGWMYTSAEMRTEMIEDLEHFAATGEQPNVATR